MLIYDPVLNAKRPQRYANGPATVGRRYRVNGVWYRLLKIFIFFVFFKKIQLCQL